MEEPRFFVKGEGLNDVTEEVKKVHKRIISNDFEEGKKYIKGEKEKSEELLSAIHSLNIYLNEELVNLDEKKIYVDPKTIHILPNNIFDTITKDQSTFATYNFTYDEILLRSQQSRMFTYQMILHEMIHKASYHVVFENRDNNLIYPIRSGYEGFKPKDLESENRFLGFNEAIVDLLTNEIVAKHKNELFNKSNFNKEELSYNDFFSDGYIDYIYIVNYIIDKIAKDNNENRDNIWNKFKKGEFSGEMTYLREIEKHFGAGSLRVLSSVGSYKENDNFDLKIRKIKAYFQSYDDKSMRSKLAEEILSEDNLKNYKKIQEKK